MQCECENRDCSGFYETALYEGMEVCWCNCHFEKGGNLK